MGSFEFMVLYVDDIAVSKTFYTRVIGKPPQELSPTFLSYVLESGLKLELCQRDSRIFPESLRPLASVLGGGTEICLEAEDAVELNRVRGLWEGFGARIVQEPTQLVFGLSFVALDPDGHRLRVSTGA